MIATLGFALAFVSAADAGALIPIPSVPGSTQTLVSGINDENVIAGVYETAGPQQHGYFGTVDGQYTTFDAPNANGSTGTGGIDDGGYVTVLSNYQTEDCRWVGCGYIRNPDGTFDALTKGGKQLDGIPGNIIQHRVFVGWYFAEDGSGVYGYLGKGDKFRSTIVLPFATTTTMPSDINKGGMVVGSFRESATGFYSAFMVKDGEASAIRYPDPAASDTFFVGVNRSGLASGSWDDDAGTFHGFLYDTASGAFAPIAVPGAKSVSPGRINNGGVVTMVVDGQSYIYCTRGKTCPVDPAKGIAIPERWVRVRAANIRTLLCANGCLGAHRKLPSAFAVR